MVNWALAVGWIGAITGIVSLGWHILNSRSKIILDRVIITKETQNTRPSTESFTINIVVRNKGNRSTTIEGIIFLIGDKEFDIGGLCRHRHIEANSSWSCEGLEQFREDKWQEIFKGGKIKIGVEIIHTFGRLKKVKETDFKDNSFSL
ncbi:MAG: hypothetical protein AABW89_03285 [Nanoarchaeota archaeon]